jgi:hypothetical protein
MTNKKCKSKGFNAEGAEEKHAEVAEEDCRRGKRWWMLLKCG